MSRKLVAGLVAIVAVASGLIGISQAQSASAGTRCTYAGTQSRVPVFPGSSATKTTNKFNCTVYRTAPMYNNYSGRVVTGTMYAGTNWVVCYVRGASKTIQVGNSIYSNNVWLYTLGDRGGWGYLNAVHVSQGGNWQAPPGVPPCITVGVF